MRLSSTKPKILNNYGVASSRVWAGAGSGPDPWVRQPRSARVITDRGSPRFSSGERSLTEPTKWLWSGPAGYSTTRQHSCGVAKAGRHLLGQLGGAGHDRSAKAHRGVLDLAADLSVALGMDRSALILLCGSTVSVRAVNGPSALHRPGRRHGVASVWLGSQPARNADQLVKLAQRSDQLAAGHYR